MKTLILLAAFSNQFGVTGQPDPYYAPNAYGTGKSMDQYGQVHDTDPNIIVTPNIYGPGVHMDQYGRPVNTNKRRLND